MQSVSSSSLFLKFESVAVIVLLSLPFATAQNVQPDNFSKKIQSASASSNGMIQHVVIIMQENRTFDHYFGTYPGANGIPRDANGAAPAHPGAMELPQSCLPFSAAAMNPSILVLTIM
jgi:phospholipase C